MLAIPLKKGKSTDISKPLYEFMKETYDESKANHFAESFTQVQMQREQFLVLFGTVKPSEGDLSFAEKYVRTVGILESKFPIDGTILKLDLSWYDCFSLSKFNNYHSIAAERAMVLFNFAALHSRAALAIKNDPGKEKQRIEYYKTAGSLFEYLRTEFLPNNNIGPTTSDFTPEGLMMLSNIMFAQAQVQLYQKALEAAKTPSPSLLASLALGIAELYKRSYDQTITANLKGILGASWGRHIIMQHYSYLAKAQEQMASSFGEKADDIGEGYGTELAWLAKAKNTAQQAVNFATREKMSEADVKAANELLRRLSDVWQAKDYDNTNIYLEPTPHESKIGVIKPRFVCVYDKTKLNPTWLSASELSESIETDPFFGLMPVAIEEAVNSFEQKLREMVVGVEREVLGSVENMREMLTEANLPMMFEVSGQSTRGGVPDAMFSRIIAMVQERGGVNELKGMLADNQDNNIRMRKVVSGLLSGLQKDDEEFNKYQATHGEKWTVPPAGESGENLKKQCFKIDGLLQEGANSDAALWEKIETGEVARALANVSLPKSDMDNLIPAGSNIDDDPYIEEARTKVQIGYINLSELMASAAAAVKTLKDECQNGTMAFAEEMSGRGDISALVKNKVELQKVVNERAKLFEEMGSDVKRFPDKFPPLLSRVMEESSRYMQSRSSNGVSQGQMSALQSLERGIEEFEKAWKAITEGKAFYQTVDMRLGKLKVMVDDHLMVRTLITGELAEALKGYEGQNNQNAIRPMSTPAPIQAVATAQPQAQQAAQQYYQQPPMQHQPQQPQPYMYQPQPLVQQPMPMQPGGYYMPAPGYTYPYQQPYGYQPYITPQPVQAQTIQPTQNTQQTNGGNQAQTNAQTGKGSFMKMFKSRRGF